jgi:flagellar hook-associated protein 3 FlgL
VTISTLSFQMNAVDQMDALQTAMSQTQTELSTGLKLQNAADNPVAMSQVDTLNTDLSASKQYVANGTLASTNLNLEAQALTNATNVLQSVRDAAIQGNNSALTAADRQDIATQLEQQLQQLVGIANSQDGQGNYLFSGYAAGTQPFAQSGNSVSYAGASSVSQVQLSAEQSISTGDTGSSVFMNIPAGNGTFTTAAASTNTGTASIGPGTVTDASQWVPGTYTIAFTSATQYTVTDAKTGAQVASGTLSSTAGSPATIAFLGVQVSLNGTPNAGDSFTVAAAGTASVFSTISGMISTLSSTTLSPAQIATQLNQGLEQVSGAINHLDLVQASVGARINAVSTAQTAAQSEQTDYQTAVSQLSNVDYAKATTQLSTEELALQAAQASYASMMSLTLFKYI